MRHAKKKSLVSLNPLVEGRGRLFCLHHAGGGGAAFRNWQRLLGSGVQVGTIVLPGRESLFGQPPFTDIEHAIGRICEDLAPVVDKPYALLGHSLGALLAFEAACRLPRLGLNPPSGLIISGRRALHLEEHEAGDDLPCSELPDAEFRDLLRKLGGTAPEILDHPEMLQLFLPVVRADFRLVERYRWDGTSRASCPILALGGEADESAGLEELGAWSALTTAATVARTFPGGHFFIATHEAQVCDVVGTFLAQTLPAASD